MTTYAAPDITSKPKHMGEFGNSVLTEGHVDVTAALTTSDKVRPCIIPAGTEVAALILAHGDLDTGTNTLVADVGYEPVSAADGPLAASTNFFKSGDTGFQSASDGRLLAGFNPIKFEQDVFLTITPSTGANAMAATKTVWASVLGTGKGVK